MAVLDTYLTCKVCDGETLHGDATWSLQMKFIHKKAIYLGGKTLLN